MKKRLLFYFGVWLFLLNTAYAQTRTITGTVTDASFKEPLPGVIVTVKGTTKATSTDVNGGFSIEVPQEATALVFTMLSMKTTEVALGTGNTVSLEMPYDVLKLDEVVVTSNAIRREKRSLGYAVSEVKSDELTRGKDRSVLNSLQGKVAGINISSASGSPGSSTRVVLRGGSSITGNNQALIVVDGIPIDNSSFQTNDNLNNQVDAGNRGNDINPEDVESITVLKGASAAALYGSRASNGVILITTKNGRNLMNRDKKSEVNFSSTYSWESVLKLPDFQNDFGEGGEGEFIPIENFSWGPKFDGSVRPWGHEVDGEQRVREWTAVDDNVKEFFDIGHTATNNLTFGGANDKSSYYLSISDLRNKGVIPGTEYNKKSIKITTTSQLTNKIYSTASVNYAKTNGLINTSGQGLAAYDQVVQTPRNISLLELKDLDNKFNTLEGYYGAYTFNPYFILANSGTETNVDHITANASVSYKPLEWLDITGRAGTDFYTDRRNQHQLKFDPTIGISVSQLPDEKGLYSETMYNVNEVTTDLMATAKKDINKDLTLNVLLGHNVRQRKLHALYASTNGLIIPDFYSLTNTLDPINLGETDNSKSMRRLYGVYLDANIAYKNYLFLGVTARNDWSSTLPKDKNSFFYPGVNGSFVFTDVLKMDDKYLSFGKIRASWAQVGNDPDPYLLSSFYVPGFADDGFNNSELHFPINYSSGAVPGYSESNRIGNANLQPEITSAFEVGADFGFLKDRLGLEFTYYNSNSSEQIIPVAIAASSGYTSQTINAGKISNKGIELLLRAKPVTLSNGFSWEITAGYAKNNNKVEELYGDIKQIALGNSGENGIAAASVVAAVGLPYGTFYAQTAMKDPQGRVVIDTLTGMPVIDPAPQLLGSYQPDFLWNVSNTFSFKGIALTILFDGKKGGVVYSRTKDVAEFVGVTENTTYNDREDFVVENSSYVSGFESNGDPIYTANSTYKTGAENYWIDQSDNGANIIDASYVKLREISLTYSLPKSIISKAKLANVEVGISGRNVMLWTPDENAFIDPEVSSMGNGNAQGYEFGSTPSIKNWAASIRITF